MVGSGPEAAAAQRPACTARACTPRTGEAAGSGVMAPSGPLLLPLPAVLAQYLYDTFNTSLTAAGALASVFGFVNLFSRPAGGILSDLAARRCGCV